MEMKRYSIIPKASALDGVGVISRTLIGGGVLDFCRDAVGVFCSLSQMGQLVEE